MIESKEEKEKLFAEVRVILKKARKVARERMKVYIEENKNKRNYNK